MLLQRGLLSFFAFAIFAASPAGAEGLSLFVVPSGETAVTLRLENRGEETTGPIRLDVDLSGASTENDLPDRLEPIPAGDHVELPLEVTLSERGELDRHTGAEATFRITADGTGETLLVVHRWSTTGCTDAFHLALQQVRGREFARLMGALKGATSPDKELPGRLLLKAPPMTEEAENLAARVAQAHGSDPFYSAEQIRWVTWRVSTDLEIYLAQDRSPGLCTGVERLVDRWSEPLSRLRERRAELTELSSQTRRRAVEAVAALGPDEETPPALRGSNRGKDPLNAGRELLAARGMGTASTPPRLFRRVAELDGAQAGPAEIKGLKETFGAIERHWYVRRARDHAAAVTSGFERVFAAILGAQERNCACGD